VLNTKARSAARARAVGETRKASIIGVRTFALSELRASGRPKPVRREPNLQRPGGADPGAAKNAVAELKNIAEMPCYSDPTAA
jgi:hypothetical protein